MAPKVADHLVMSSAVAQPHSTPMESICSKKEMANSGRLAAHEKSENTETDSDRVLITSNSSEKPPAVDENMRKPAFFHSSVEAYHVGNGEERVVVRSDGDAENRLWPLFFVQLESNVKFVDDYLDRLEPERRLAPDEVAIGKLCIAFSVDYSAFFRAVITQVMDREAKVEVHYVDYGNYEVITVDGLWSIEEMKKPIRNSPAMAIPCVLSEYCKTDDVPSSSCGNSMLDHELKERVTSDEPFCVQFKYRRNDGVRVVQLLDERLWKTNAIRKTGLDSKKLNDHQTEKDRIPYTTGSS
ncbi:hypothetical protein AB6A40_008543 [Gnathostoma spinigerum]|uniref:Tudor domain-containing protein n=1 Tax=Gnathostoma spinigerum TaxID=75299 RepID=A0ABD6EUH0_9BILA